MNKMKIYPEATTYHASYNTQYVCKYKDQSEINKYKNIEEKVNVDIDVEIDIENELYRLDLLNIFKLETYDSNYITKTIDNIFDNIIEKNSNYNSSVERFKEYIKKASALFMSEDIKFGFTIMFSYEYLNSTHKCLCELMTMNNIKTETLDELESLFD